MLAHLCGARAEPPQLCGLQEFKSVLDGYKSKGLNIVAFPCNQFGGQEPGTNAEIKSFAAGKGFSGLLMDKVDVNGPNASPIFTWLKANSGDDSPTPWNFEKHLVGKDGTVHGRYGPQTSPAQLVPEIEKLL